MAVVAKTVATARRTKRRGRHPDKALSAAFVRAARTRRGQERPVPVRPTDRNPKLSPAARHPRPTEETDHLREVIEAALAYVVQNKVEAAYARSDRSERRRRLMGDWVGCLARDGR